MNESATVTCILCEKEIPPGEAVRFGEEMACRPCRAADDEERRAVEAAFDSAEVHWTLKARKPYELPDTLPDLAVVSQDGRWELHETDDDRWLVLNVGPGLPNNCTLNAFESLSDAGCPEGLIAVYAAFQAWKARAEELDVKLAMARLPPGATGTASASEPAGQ